MKKVILIFSILIFSLGVLTAQTSWDVFTNVKLNYIYNLSDGELVLDAYNDSLDVTGLAATRAYITGATDFDGDADFDGLLEADSANFALGATFGANVDVTSWVNADSINYYTALVGGGYVSITDSTRQSSDYAYLVDIDGDDYFTGGAAQKTYLMNLGGSRPATDTMSGDSRDRMIAITYSNYAANDANSQMHLIGANLRNRSGGEIAHMHGSEFGINNSSGATATDMLGFRITCENYGTVSDNFDGLKIDMRNESSVATDERALYITNSNNSVADAVAAAIYIDDSGANTGWDYILDADGATVQSAEVRGSSGETIANTTDGFWDFSGTMRADTFMLPMPASGTMPDGAGAWATTFVDTNGTDSLIIMVGATRRGIAIE